MRTALLVATTMLLMPVAGHAQILTDSPSEDLQMVKDWVLQQKQWITQQTQVLHEAATDLNTANTYLQEVQTYLAFVQNPSLANAMGLLNAAGLGSDLPANPLQVMALANGFTSMSSGGSLSADLAKLRMLAGYANGAFGVNHVYTCTATDQTCTDLNGRANGIAGSMGIAQTGYADIQAHQAAIAGLRADLVGTTDPAKRETVIAQIGTEQLYIQSTLASLTAAGQQANLAQQSDRQRTLERQRASADAFFADTQPITGLINAPPAPPLFSAAN